MGERGCGGDAVVVGSGLAGLSCALEAAQNGWRVTVVTPGRAGRDGASHRVHLLAPWILLTAPRVRGDSPDEFARDLTLRGGGLDRPGLGPVFAQLAHQASAEIIELLDLAVLDDEPVLLPGGDRHPRGLRCVPRRPGALLASLEGRCRDAGVQFREQALVTELQLDSDGGVAGVVAVDRREGGVPQGIRGDAVVLACGGVGGAFALATGPRWCRGSGLALAAAARALLHHPNLLQALPVALRPRGYFPGTRLLLEGTVRLGDVALPRAARLTELTRSLAQGLSRLPTASKEQATLEPRCLADLPEPLLRDPAVVRTGRLPIGVGVHHSVGGVAIDEWGRTSVPGLYACGEAAGGVQGRERTMGTGLLEARIFAVRVARALIRDAGRLRGREAVTRSTPRVPLHGEVLERHLDQETTALAVIVSRSRAERVWRDLFQWPSERRERYAAGDGAAGLRLWALMEVLESALREESLQQGGGEGV